MNKKISPKEVSLLIPVYNNEKTIIEQLKKCEKIMRSLCKDYEIVIAEDKSKDQTPKILKGYVNRKNYRLILNKTNLGISKNIRQLYKIARLKYCLLFSIDGGWDPNDIKRLINTAYEKNADIVIGKRDKKNYSLYRKLISYFYNLLPLLFFGVNTKDTGSIKIIKRKLFEKIKLKSKSIFFEAELIIKAKKMGCKILWIPIKFNKARKEEKRYGARLSLVKDALFDLILNFSDLRSRIPHNY